jgi:preprotein translocase subunit SecA
MGLLTKIFGTHSDREIKRILPLADRIESYADAYAAMPEAELVQSTERFRARLAAGETLDDLLPEAFATVREAAWRVLGMKHYRVQLIGGIVLHQGRIAEMKTGEGKTLVAPLAVYLNALAGKGVHVVTVNDYLARRDSEWMGKIYRYLGLSVGLIVHGLDNAQRRESYASDVTYGTNNEFGFDYLRDNMVIRSEDRVQRTLSFAIVDEVDSILIDEARTPLIISGMGEKSTDLYEKADLFAKRLKARVVTELDDKQDYEETESEADYIVDEKANTAVLTAEGVRKAERHFGVANLADADNYTLQHHLSNALRAHGLMKLDQQYVVKDGEVIIVDDFTGRLMFGRRYSDGLHQAIEAKEGVKVERESKTLATITFQNYFRMYGKLSGMTGTALTEEEEFRAIYSLDVITVPTHRDMIRLDEPDAVFKSLQGKYKALLEEVTEVHATGQPILIGTVSVERSEFLSTMMKRNGIPHSVLNAKQHDREAEIVAQAGRLGQVTIATNMAGRGTDILLGGNPEYLAKQEMRKQGIDEVLIDASTAHNETSEPLVLDARRRYAELYERFHAQTDAEHVQVVAAGGLYIMGTERHESRRIDNQLRGRSGRQGDPGRSRFFMSLEDDLMRLFGGDRMLTMFNMLGVEEDMPIEHPMLSNAIETAQKRVEGRNFNIRKHVLEYDDVMNKQREVIYGQRLKVLEGQDLHDTYLRMVISVSERVASSFCNDVDIPERWDWAGFDARIRDVFGEIPAIRRMKDALATLDAARAKSILVDAAGERYMEREPEVGGPEILREAERIVLLRTVDEKWMDHIDAMDELRSGIGMRGYAQLNPVIEYRREGFEMFESMNLAIQEDAVRMMMKGRFTVEQPLRRQSVAPRNLQESHGDTGFVSGGPQPSPTTAPGPGPRGAPPKAPEKKASAPAVAAPKVGRNDPCPCGSGKKYKNCHGASTT